MKRDDCVREMEALLATCEAERRVFTDDEAARFAELKVMATAMEQQMDDVIEQPLGRTTAVAGAARSLSAAAIADGLVARMVQNGRARVDIPIDIRNFGSSQALAPAPGLVVPPQNLGVISTYYPIVSRLLNALASIPVTGNAVTFSRLFYKEPVGSPPDSGGNNAAKVQELALKPESILDTEEATQVIDTWAHWLPCSKQVLDDVTGLRALLDVTLVNGLLDKTDAGVFAAMTTMGRFTGFIPTSPFDYVAEGVATAATQLIVAGATSVKVALHPLTVLAMSLQKTNGSGEYQGRPSIPATIVSSASVPEGKLLAWADSGAVWANREGVSVVAGLNNDDFTRNKITLLAEHRGSVLTLNPAHVLYGDATDA